MRAFSKLLIGALLLFTLTGCASNANPLNRSLLFDSGLKLGGNIPLLPFPLPEIDLGLHINFRRPTIQEEIDLNLSKQGKWRGMEQPKPPEKSSPTPFPAVGDIKKE